MRRSRCPRSAASISPKRRCCSSSAPSMIGLIAKVRRGRDVNTIVVGRRRVPRRRTRDRRRSRDHRRDEEHLHHRHGPALDGGRGVGNVTWLGSQFSASSSTFRSRSWCPPRRAMPRWSCRSWPRCPTSPACRRSVSVTGYPVGVRVHQLSHPDLRGGHGWARSRPRSATTATCGSWLPFLLVDHVRLWSGDVIGANRERRHEEAAVRVVVALGGNALLRRGEPMTVENQRANVALACDHLASVALRHELVISHGNGPQIGLLALEGAAVRGGARVPARRARCRDPGDGRLPHRAGARQPLAVRPPAGDLLTMIEVDPADPAFADPSKPIGPDVQRRRGGSARPPSAGGPSGRTAISCAGWCRHRHRSASSRQRQIALAARRRAAS